MKSSVNGSNHHISTISSTIVKRLKMSFLKAEFPATNKQSIGNVIKPTELFAIFLLQQQEIMRVDLLMFQVY